jgi:hypothetical protein
MRRHLLALGLALALAAVLPRLAAAQTAPADTAGVLVELARQFEMEGRRELAQALLAVVVERYPGSAAAIEARTRLALLRGAVGERSGRTELLVGGTVYGLWLGAAVPAALGAENVTPYGIGLLAGGPAGFLLARELSSGRDIGEGQARAITFGALWGTWQGAGWRHVLGIGDKVHRYECGGPPEYCLPDGYTYTETSGRAIFAAMIVGGLTGIGTGALLASRGPIPADRMTVANFGALWGTWYGTAAMLLTSRDPEGNDVLTAALVGGDLGLLVSALAAPKWELSRSRARLISVAGVAGGVAGLGLDLLLETDDTRVAILIPMLTSAAGLAAGALWTRGHDDPRPQPGGHEEDGALLRLGGGGTRLGLSLPEPVLLPADRAGTRRVLGARMTLLRATF